MAWTTPKTWTAAVVAVTDMNTHVRDNLTFLHTSGQLFVGASQMSFGAAVRAQSHVYLAGSFAPADAGVFVAGFHVASSVTGTPGDGLYGSVFSQTLVEAASGVHSLIAGAYFSAPTITGGVATATDATTVYISGPTTATVTGGNYSLFVDSGQSRFDGAVILGSDLYLPAANIFYLDGGGNTYIQEQAADVVGLFAGGVRSARFSNAGLAVDPTLKLFLDGGGDTYWIESTANVAQLFVGGAIRLEMSTTLAYFDNVDLSVEPTKKTYFDGGSNTYMVETAGDQLDTFAGGVNVFRATTTGTRSFVDLEVDTYLQIVVGTTAQVYSASSPSTNRIGGTSANNWMGAPDVWFRMKNRATGTIYNVPGYVQF